MLFQKFDVCPASARVDDVVPASSLFAGQVDGDMHMAVAAHTMLEQVHNAHSRYPFGSTSKRLRSVVPFVVR